MLSILSCFIIKRDQDIFKCLDAIFLKWVKEENKVLLKGEKLNWNQRLGYQDMRNLLIRAE